MKKLLLILLLFPLSVFSTEWIEYGTNDKGSVFYYDKVSFKKVGNKRFVLQLTDYVKPSKYGDLSSLNYQEVDCEKNTIKTTMFRTYTLPMGGGELTTSMNPNEIRKIPINDNTLYGILFRVVCLYL